VVVDLIPQKRGIKARADPPTDKPGAGRATIGRCPWPVGQLVDLDNPRAAVKDRAELDALAGEAAATLAEFRPASFPEALLATQMIGTQRMALPCLQRAAALGMDHDEWAEAG